MISSEFVKKLTVLLFCAMCIPPYRSKIAFFILAICFHASKIHSILHIVIKINYAYATLTTKLLFDCLTIAQWWSIFFKRNEIFQLSTFLDSKLKGKRYSSFIKGLVILLYILLIATFLERSSKLMLYIILKPSELDVCLTNVCTKYSDTSATVFAIELIYFYLKASLAYIPSFLYSYFAVLILCLQPQLSEDAVQRDTICSLYKCRVMVSAIKMLEDAMSSIIFMVFLQQGLTVLTLISSWTDHTLEPRKEYHYLSSLFKLVAYFLCVSFSADVLQRRCHRNLALVFGNPNAVNCVDNKYLTYKQLIRNSTLTGWDVFKINRTAVLTFVSTLVTFGVILFQLKADF